MLKPEEAKQVLGLCLREGLIQQEGHDKFIISDLGIHVGRFLFILSLNEITFNLIEAQENVLSLESKILQEYREFLSKHIQGEN